MKYVVARNEGPGLNHPGFGKLTPGKSYEVICRSTSVQFESIELNYNPKKPEFYIDIIDDRGIKHSVWNDYFYSTIEMRQMKLKRILNDN